MGKSLNLVQQIQDVYANDCQLGMVLLDLEGQLVTRPSGNNQWVRMIEEVNPLLHDWMKRMTETGVVDLFPGAKIVLSPVSVLGEIRYFIWAGFLIEEESRTIFYDYLEGNADQCDLWKVRLEDIPSVTNETKKHVVEKLKGLSEALSKILDDEPKQMKQQQRINSVYEISELMSSEQTHTLSRVLQEFMKVDQEIDFVGFAQKTDNGDGVVLHFDGPSDHSPLIGARFSVGEGFLGQVMASGLSGYWKKIARDPRGTIFIKNDIKLRSLVCYPVQNEETLLGVLFAGSCRKDDIDSFTLDTGKIIANLLQVFLLHQSTTHTYHQQLQKLNALMEISQLITRTQDVKKIAFMLVDMSVNIMQVKFSAVTLFDEAQSEEVRIVSRGLTKDQSEKYGKQLLQQFQKWKVDREDFKKMMPMYQTIEGRGSVIECPMYSQKLHGVLSVALDPKSEEQEAFLYSLATIGAIAINQSKQSQNGMRESVTHLHDAMGFWDPQSHAFTQKLRDWVLLFSVHLNLPDSEMKIMEYACLLSPYPVDLIVRTLPQEEPLHQMLRDFAFLKEYKANSDPNQPLLGVGSQILFIVFDYLKGEERIYGHPCIQETLTRDFRSFILKEQIVDQKVSVKEEHSLPVGKLSNRENEVLLLLVQGLNNKQIATHLFISEHTVKNHITNIFQKLDVKDRAGVIAYYYKYKTKN
ncbi:DNA-binding CsgD family transcriptional regulator/transcriptional regulator with GAF, ATPase, and Fis domain [Pullulanibacillus pueri]|uniref:HTH luxR-type domain-containing protein n=1 Tax=Pullulanibacillus pueri TaxID=1437324 RepID=A0A8J2ZWA0_9BACL|nr:LuxR C-terminal-related transcriptional regulator [Pullulanibacillus pueri]MBM7682802.1 DNA-binding CsgD family transcriptional regulator/transcriptional regulator with GAF, ATPase, and Fis domain [Pullulanibacillus pueri]GGH83242.1 hypothetical protein GCM10007096_23820 [Pullulanibacillus pueri]